MSLITVKEEEDDYLWVISRQKLHSHNGLYLCSPAAAVVHSPLLQTCYGSSTLTEDKRSAMFIWTYSGAKHDARQMEIAV